MNQQIIVPKKTIPLLKEAVAQILAVPADDIEITDENMTAMSHGMALLEVYGSGLNGDSEGDELLARELSKLLKVPAFTSGVCPDGTLDEYIDGEFFKRLKVNEEAIEENGEEYIRFIDPPEGVTDP